jgi:hypothetical protein
VDSASPQLKKLKKKKVSIRQHPDDKKLLQKLLLCFTDMQFSGGNAPTIPDCRPTTSKAKEKAVFSPMAAARGPSFSDSWYYPRPVRNGKLQCQHQQAPPVPPRNFSEK